MLTQPRKVRIGWWVRCNVMLVGASRGPAHFWYVGGGVVIIFRPSPSAVLLVAKTSTLAVLNLFRTPPNTCGKVSTKIKNHTDDRE